MKKRIMSFLLAVTMICQIFTEGIVYAAGDNSIFSSEAGSEVKTTNKASSILEDNEYKEAPQDNSQEEELKKNNETESLFEEQDSHENNQIVIEGEKIAPENNRNNNVDLENPKDEIIDNAIIDEEENKTEDTLEEEKEIQEPTEKNIKEENNKIISEEEKVLDEFIESENFEENKEAVSTEMGVYNVDLKDIHYVEDKDGNWTYETGLVTYFTVPKDVTSGFEFAIDLPEEINVGGIKNSDVTLGTIKNQFDSLINVYLQNGRIVYKITNYGAEVISQTPFGISGNFTIGIKEDDANVALVDDYNYNGGVELYKGVSINKSGLDNLKNLLPEDNSLLEGNNSPLDKREVELTYTSTFGDREILLKDSVKAYESENFNNKTKYIYNYETNFIKDFDDYYKEQSFEINRFNLLKTDGKESSTIKIKSSNDVKKSDDIVIRNEAGEILYPGEWNDFVKETRDGFEINLPTENGVYPKISITYKSQIDNIEEESKTEVILADKLYTEDTAINNFKTEIISSKIDDKREVENDKANYNSDYFTENTPIKDDVTLDKEVSLISNKSSESQDEILDMINRAMKAPAKANKSPEQVWLEKEINALGKPVRKLTQGELDTLKQKFLQNPDFVANLTATEENFDKLIKQINLEDAQAWVTEKLTALKNEGKLNDQSIAQVKSEFQQEFPNVNLNDINWQESTPPTSGTTYPYQLAYTDKSSLKYADGSSIDAFGHIDKTKKLQVWWDIEVDVSEVNQNSDLDYDSLNLAFHAPTGQGLNKFIFAASNDKDQLDNEYNYARSETVGGDLDVGYLTIPKSQITGDKIYLRVKADVTEYHPKYSLGVRINPDSNYINNIVDKFIQEFESIPTIFKWMKGVEEARQYADIPFNLLDVRLTAGGIENELKAEEFYSDSSRYVFASQSGSSISWHITDLLRLGETPDENIKDAKFYPATAGVNGPKIFIPLIEGGYRQVNSIGEATAPNGQIYPGTILSYGTGRQDIDLGKRDEIEINFKEKFKDANSNYLSEEAQKTAAKEGGVNTSYVVMKTQTELDAEYRMYYETPFSTDIFRINKTFEMAFCLNLEIPEPSVSYDPNTDEFIRDPALERTQDPSGLDILNNINNNRNQKVRLEKLLNNQNGEFYNPNIRDYNAKVEDLFKRVFYYADQMKIEYEKENGKRLNRVLESQMIQRMIHYITDIKGLYYVYYTEGYEPDYYNLISRQILLGASDIDNKNKELPQFIPDEEGIANDPKIQLVFDQGESAKSYYIRNKQAALARQLYAKVVASYKENSDWNENKRDSVDLTLYTHGRAGEFQQLITAYVNRPVEVKKVDRDEKTLAGVEFKITNLDSGKTFTWTSKENEKDEVYLKPGRYRLEETKTPEDYEPIKPIDFEVVKKEEEPRDLFFPTINKDIHVNDYVHNIARLRQGTEVPMSADGTKLLYKAQDNKDMGFVVKNVPDDLGKLEFTKTDGVNPLKGVEFTLLKVDDEGKVINGEDGKPVFEKVLTGENGKYLFEGIPVDNYILRETKTPEGFEKLEDIKVTAIKETDPQTGKTKVVVKFVDTNLEETKTLVNKPEKIGIEFQKYSNNQKRPLKGGRFVLYQKSGTSYSYYKEASASEVKVIRDNQDNIIGHTGGRFIFDELSIGEYILEERLAPEGYDKVKYTDEEGKEHLMKWLVKVELNKEELEQNPDSKNKLKYTVYEYKNGELGNEIETTEIINGDQKDSVYRINNEPYQTDMSFKKMTRDIVDGKVQSEKELTQRDLLRGANGKPVEFALYNSDYYGAKLHKDGSIPKPNETPEPIQTVTADKDGKFNFTNLTTGQYYKLEEVNPPLGYDKLQNGLLLHVVSYGGPNLRVVLRDPSNNAVVDEQNVLQFVVNTKGKLGELKVKKTGNALPPYQGEIGLRRAYFRLYYADENFNKRKDPETGIEYIQKITEGLTQQDPDTGKGRDPSTLPENQGMAVFDNLRPGKYILEEYRGPAGYERTHDYWKITVGTDGTVTKEHVRVDENATDTRNNISRAPKLNFETLSKINPEVYSSQANAVEEAANKADTNIVENNSMLANMSNEDNNPIEKYRIENQDNNLPKELNNAITGSNYDVLDKYLENSTNLLAKSVNRAPARVNRVGQSPEANVFEDKNLKIEYDQMLYETDKNQVTVGMNIFGKSTREEQDKSLSVMLLVDRAQDNSRDGSMDETVNKFIQSLVDKAKAEGITLNIGLADYGTPTKSHPDGGQELRNPYSERVKGRYPVTELVDKKGNVKLAGNYLEKMYVSPRSNSINLQYQTVKLNDHKNGKTQIGSPFLTTYVEEESWKNETWNNSDKKIFVSFSHLESDFQDSSNGLIDGKTEYAFNKKDFANGLNLLRQDAEVFSFLFSKSLPEQRVEGSIPMADKGSMRLYEYMKYNNLIDYDHSFIFSNRNSWNDKLAEGAKQGYKTNKYGQTDTRVDYPDTVDLVLDKFPDKATATNVGTINKGTIDLNLKAPLKIAGYTTSGKNGKLFNNEYIRKQINDNLLKISDISLKDGENIRVQLTLDLSGLTPNQLQDILSWQIKPDANAEAYDVTTTPQVKYNKAAPPVGDKYSQTVKFVFTDDPGTKPGGLVGWLRFEVMIDGEWKPAENPFDKLPINAGGFANAGEIIPVVYDKLDSNKKYRVKYESTESSWGRLPNPEYFDIDFSKADPETKRLPDIEIQQGHTIKVFNKDETGFRIPLRIKKTAEDGYPLDGANFRARKIIDGEEGTAYYNEAYDQISAATGLSGDNYFRELSPGVYELTETKVPAGFREDVKNKKWYFKVERNKAVAETAANSMVITFDFTENINASTKFTKGISEEEKQNLIALGTIVGIGNASVLQNNDYITIVPQDEDDGRSKPARPDAPYPTIDEIGVKNYNATTKFNFQKFDETGRNILGEAEFKLTKTDKDGKPLTKNVDGKEVPVYEQVRTSDTNSGFVEFDGLTKNSAEDGDKYILEEVKAPAGYEASKAKFGLQVFVSDKGSWEIKYLDESNPLVVFRDGKVAGIKNNLSRIDFNFKKVDSKGNDVNVSRFQLQGVDKDNNVIEKGNKGYYNSIKYTTSTPNYRFEDLEEGRYKLTETNYTKYEKPHDWYFNVVRDENTGRLSFDFSELQNDKTFDYVLNSDDGTYEVKVINYERINFAIQKIDISEKDKEDKDIKGLQNAKFSLKKIYTKDLTIDELNDKTTKDKYFIEYEMNGDKFVLDEDGNVKTVDPEKSGYGYYEEKSLLGFTSHTFEGLSEGIYELEELKPPQGYENSKDQRKWIIKVVKDDEDQGLKVVYDKDFESSYYNDIDNDKPGKVVLDNDRTPNLILGINGSKTRIINSRDTIDLKFKKTDSGENPLAGASFRLDKISNDSKDLDAAKVKDPKILSTKFGESVLKEGDFGPIAEVLIKGLDEGIYILKETNNPEGYKLPNRDFVVQVTESVREEHPAGYLIFNIYERDLSGDTPKIIDKSFDEDKNNPNLNFINLIFEGAEYNMSYGKYSEIQKYRIKNFKDIGFKFLKVAKDEDGFETIKRGKLKVKLEPDESLEIPWNKKRENYIIEKEFNLLQDYDQMTLQLENPITGDYILTEVQAPIGYTKTKNKYKIHMDIDKETVTLVAVLDADGKPLTNDNGENITEDGEVIPDGGIDISTNADKFNLNIVNEKSVFPWTGGPGTIIFTLGGSMIMAAGAYLYLRKRRYAED